MPAEQKCVPAIRTVRLRIAATTNPGKVSALAATVAEWNRAVAFDTDLFLDHPGVFEARKTVRPRSAPAAGTTKEGAWSEKDWRTWVEAVTVATPAHPHILSERDFEAACPGCPRDLRSRRGPTRT